MNIQNTNNPNTSTTNHGQKKQKSLISSALDKLGSNEMKKLKENNVHQNHLQKKEKFLTGIIEAHKGVFKNMTPHSKEVLEEISKIEKYKKFFSVENIFESNFFCEAKLNTQLFPWKKELRDKMMPKTPRCAECNLLILNDKKSELPGHCLDCNKFRSRYMNELQQRTVMKFRRTTMYRPSMTKFLRFSKSKLLKKPQDVLVFNSLYSKYTFSAPLVSSELYLSNQLNFPVPDPCFAQHSNLIIEHNYRPYYSSRSNITQLVFDINQFIFNNICTVSKIHNALTSRAIASWKKKYKICFNPIDQTFYSHDTNLVPHVRLNGQPLDINNYSLDDTPHNKIGSNADTIIWMVFLSENVFLSSTDKGGLYIVDMRRKKSRFMGTLWMDHPVLVRQALKIDDQCLMVVADNYLIELKLSQDHWDDLSDFFLKNEKCQVTFLKGYEDCLEFCKKAGLDSLKKYDNPFFTGFFSSQETENDSVAKRKIDNLNAMNGNTQTKDEKFRSGVFYDFKELLKISKKKSISYKKEFDSIDIDKIHLKALIVRKLDLSVDSSIWGSRQVSNLQKHCKILTFDKITIVINYAQKKMEFFCRESIDKDLKLDYNIPGTPSNAIINYYFGQLIILTQLPEDNGKYSALVYNIPSILKYFEAKIKSDL